MGQVLWLLAAWVFWAGVFSLVFFLVRLVARDCDEEQRVCELGEDYFRQPAAQQPRALAL